MTYNVFGWTVIKPYSINHTHKSANAGLWQSETWWQAAVTFFQPTVIFPASRHHYH